MMEPSPRIRCTLHNVEFQAWGDGFESQDLSCPICNRIERVRMMGALKAATEQRDALAKAIEVKLLLTPLA